MQQLAVFVRQRITSAQSTYQKEGQRIGLARSALRRIVYMEFQGLPEIETLQKIARGYDVPLWYVMELAGVDLDLERTAQLTEEIRTVQITAVSGALWVERMPIDNAAFALQKDTTP